MLVLAASGVTVGACSLVYDLGSFSGSRPDVTLADGAPGANGDGADAGNGSVDGAGPVDGSTAVDAGQDAGPDAPAGCVVQSTNTKTPNGSAVSGGGGAWSAISKSHLEDGTGATVVLVADGTSQTLLVYDFSFAVPGGASIRGVQVQVRARGVASDPEDIRDEELRLAPGGVPGGQDLASARYAVTFVTRDYGGPTNLWSLALTPAIVNSSTFGVAFRTGNHGVSAGTAEVDAIRVTVFYCPP